MEQYRKKIRHNNVTYHCEADAVQSVDPPMAHFGFTYWSQMIPPVKPEKMLMLGCGGHTIPKLIEKVWGKFDLTCNEDKDAFDFARDLRKAEQKFDYIVVDVYEGPKPHPGILTQDFLNDLYTISTGLIAVNATTFAAERPYLTLFDEVLVKAIKNNVVTFLKHRDDTRQYFVILPHSQLHYDELGPKNHG